MAKKSISAKAILAKATATAKAKAVAGKAREGSKYGKATGLMLTHCCNAMFSANENIQAPCPELQEWLRGEYPNRQAMQSISAYRSYYNKMLHGFGGKGLHSNSFGRLTAEARKNWVVTNHREATATAAKGKPAKGKPAAKPAKGKATKGKATKGKATKPARKATKPARKATATA